MSNYMNYEVLTNRTKHVKSPLAVTVDMALSPVPSLFIYSTYSCYIVHNSMLSYLGQP